MSNVIETLQERGFIEALTSEEIAAITTNPVRVYCGFDPTADSLHLGNLVAIIGLAWFQRFGHTPVALIGGATGMVGDPSGKSKERTLLDEAMVEHNLKGIQKNLEAVLDFNHPTAKPLIVNNYDWFKKFDIIQFLRDVGKHFRVGPMLAKESVRARMESEEGISYTEFSYQLLQGYDFYHLYSEEGVTVQLGGSDQWGNITAGIDLVRRLSQGRTFGVTFPLLTRSDGKKFGKTEEGTIWLSPERLSPYEFYQYLIRIPDADVIRLLKVLTFLDLKEIAAIEQSMSQPNYQQNAAQKRLAEEVTRLVHGNEGLVTAQRVTEGARPGSDAQLDAATLENLARDMPSATLSMEDAVGRKLLDLIVSVGLQGSRAEAKRLIRNGGVYLNNQKIEDEQLVVHHDHLVEGRLLLLGVGKKKKMIVRIAGT